MEAAAASSNRRIAPSSGWGFWTLIRAVFVGVLTLLAVTAILGTMAAWYVYDYAMHDGAAGPAVEVTVPDGATGRDIGTLLVAHGLLEHEAFFRIALWAEPEGPVIRHGVYALPEGYSARQLLARLRRGPDRMAPEDQVRVTIPEGLTIRQIAERFDDAGAFVAAASEPERVARLGIDVPNLEGFLMPDTYFFDEAPEPAELVDRMLDEFLAAYAAIAAEVPDGEDYDKLTVVTVASLVEEEARLDAERPIVAAVVYNRLDEDMPLQMDATLQFALNKYGQRMLDEDKETDSPYNSYRYRGLPPGPISNPGRASLRAAFSPKRTDYLYFVSNADGMSHTFSRTLRDHNRAVARYRREIAEQRREQAASK